MRVFVCCCNPPLVLLKGTKDSQPHDLVNREVVENGWMDGWIGVKHRKWKVKHECLFCICEMIRGIHTHIPCISNFVGTFTLNVVLPSSLL